MVEVGLLQPATKTSPDHGSILSLTSASASSTTAMPPPSAGLCLSSTGLHDHSHRFLETQDAGHASRSPFAKAVRRNEIRADAPGAPKFSKRRSASHRVLVGQTQRGSAGSLPALPATHRTETIPRILVIARSHSANFARKTGSTAMRFLPIPSHWEPCGEKTNANFGRVGFAWPTATPARF